MNNTDIIIVEDEGLIALDLKKKLEQFGYTVPMIADTAVGALLGVERLKPALVLMDIRLRGPQDGIETADQIRKRFHVPVIFVTAHADLETLDRARITEPFGYIVKPFHSIDFRAQIEMALWKHRMEQKLRISEAWLSTIFRNVADALIATDSDGNIAFMNATAGELTGWDWKEAKGQPLLEVFQAFEELTGLPVVHPLEALYEGRELGTGRRTFQLRARGGADLVSIEAELSANRDEESLVGIIVVFRDVSERRKAEKQNTQLQKMNSLALMAIGLGRELTESQARIDDSMQELIARSEGSTLRLLGDVWERSGRQQSVVHQLIALGRKDTGQPALVDLNEILTELQTKFRKGPGNRHFLSLNLGPGVPRISVDPYDLRENLSRLIVDARDATPNGGAVEVSTMKIDSGGGRFGVQVVIRDTGRGLRVNAVDRVFDPYYQSRPGSRNPGLSLALVYHFVALSGGVIEVDSTPGNGTAYLLSFPAAYVPNALPAIDQEPERSPVSR